MHAAVGSLDPSRTPANTFDGLLKQTESILVNSGITASPGAAKILHVHSIRNDAQHRARVPLEAEVSEGIVQVREYLSELIRLVWGLTLERISIVETVQDPAVREHLLLAEAARLKHRFRRATSAVFAQIAFPLIAALILGVLGAVSVSWLLFRTVSEPLHLPVSSLLLTVVAVVALVLLVTAVALPWTGVARRPELLRNE